MLVALDSILRHDWAFEATRGDRRDIRAPMFRSSSAGIPAICRGRGEIIQPFDVFEKLKLLLLKPPFGVETPWAYKAWAASRSLPGRSRG